MKHGKKIGRPKAVDKKKLFNMLRQGKTQKECADFFGVTPSAISQHRKTMNLAIAANTNLETGASLVSEGLDALGQLRRINGETNLLIDLLSGWIKGDPISIKRIERQHRLLRIGHKKSVNAVTAKDPRELMLKAVAEVKSQLRLSLDILESLHNIEAVEHFQRTVISIIQKCQPEVANEIIKELQQYRALRGSMRLA